MALPDVIDQYVTTFGTMTGLQKCYANPPEAMTEFPCAIVYVQSGSMSVGAHGTQSIHDIILEIHHSRQILPEAMDAAKVWPEQVISKLYNGETFSGYVAAIVWPVTYEAGGREYGSEIHYTMRFRIPTKVIGAP